MRGLGCLRCGTQFEAPKAQGPAPYCKNCLRAGGHNQPKGNTTQRTIDKIRCMVENLGTDDGGLEEFLREVFTTCRNSFFSHDYEQLPEHIRETVEQAVYCATVQGVPGPLRDYL